MGGERCVNKVFDKHLSNIFGILKTCKIPRCLYCSSLQQAANGNQGCIELITKTEKCYAMVTYSKLNAGLTLTLRQRAGIF